MNMKALIWVIVAIVIIGGGWFWWSSTQVASAPTTTTSVGEVASSTTTTTTTTTSSAYVAGNLLLGTDSSAKLGTYLIASNGMTLYMYTKDTPGVSTCTDQCAVNWPPYTISSRDALANVQAGISGKVGTIARADGSMQVTYNGKPLYFWIRDSKSGDTNGQNIGGVWFVVKP